MRFFRVRPEDRAATRSFRETCAHDSLDIQLSRRTLLALQSVAGRKRGESIAELSLSVLMPLSRRGMIRADEEGEWFITEIGLLTVALAEAGGLFIPKHMNDVK